jgi:hypothetical protein
LYRWEFKTGGHDIGFGLYFKGQLDSEISMSIDEMDEMVHLGVIIFKLVAIKYVFVYQIPIKRWECSRVPEDGQFIAELAGTCE